MWGESERPAILPKTKGSGIMVSDFVEEYGGYLKLSPEELDHAKSKYPNIEPAARRLLEYGAVKEGIGLAIVSWGRSGMQPTLLMSSMGLHTPLCVCVKSDDLALQQNSRKGWGSPESEDTVWGGNHSPW